MKIAVGMFSGKAPLCLDHVFVVVWRRFERLPPQWVPFLAPADESGSIALGPSEFAGACHSLCCFVPKVPLSREYVSVNVTCEFAAFLRKSLSFMLLSRPPVGMAAGVYLSTGVGYSSCRGYHVSSLIFVATDDI